MIGWSSPMVGRGLVNGVGLEGVDEGCVCVSILFWVIGGGGSEGEEERRQGREWKQGSWDAEPDAEAEAGQQEGRRSSELGARSSRMTSRGSGQGGKRGIAGIGQREREGGDPP